jgi:hypothetical protein
MKYLLKYKETEVGTVEGREEDFLNLWGSFSKNANLKNESLLKFISLSIRESGLIEEDYLRDISNDLDSLEVELKPFKYFIESEDWKLIKETGEELNILAPSFKPDNSIVWRWRI